MGSASGLLREVLHDICLDKPFLYLTPTLQEENNTVNGLTSFLTVGWFISLCLQREANNKSYLV